MNATTEFYAIKRNADKTSHHFEWEKESFFTTREELEKAIDQWKKRVTPRMVENTRFEIHQS